MSITKIQFFELFQFYLLNFCSKYDIFFARKGIDCMKRKTTAERLKQIMEERNLKQIDILNMSLPICAKYDVKMNKSDISQYVSGKVEPSQEKLVVLGLALNVTESWLMGFDVSPHRKDSKVQAEKDFEFFYKFSLLNDRDKKIVLDMIETMLSSEEKEAND